MPAGVADPFDQGGFGIGIADHMSTFGLDHFGMPRCAPAIRDKGAGRVLKLIARVLSGDGRRSGSECKARCAERGEGC